MKCSYLKSKFEYIELLFTYFSSLQLDIELKSHISKYLTVLISGMYEDMIKNLVKEYVFKETTSKEIKNFTSRQMKYIFRNPESKNIQQFLNRFNKRWYGELMKKVDQTNLDALNSIVNNKNLIAHGNTSTITYEDIKTYYNESKIILEELDSIILNDDT